MSRGLGTALLLRVAAGLALLAALTGLAEHARGLRVELGPNRLVTLTPELRARLARLDHPVRFTYWVSAPERMPPGLRHLGRDVGDLLESMARAAPGRVTWRVVDPADDETLTRYAARRKVSPRRVRELRDDAWSEREIWSTLSTAYGPRPPSALRGLGPEHLPRLQSLLAAQLDEIEHPRPARILLRAPEQGYDLLRERLSARGELLPADAPLAAADVLWWLEPREVTAEQVLELERFLEEGGSALVAGSELSPSLEGAGELRALVVEPSGFDARALWEPFGLLPVDALLLDENSAPMPVDGGLLPAPFRLTSIAPDQDFQTLPGEPNGHLLFLTPTALRPDERGAARSGWQAEVLASTSDRSWTQELQDDRLPLVALTPDEGRPLPKQALLVHLRHADPWRGTLTAAAAASPFQDAFLGAETMAHERLVEVLLDEQLRPERRVLRGAGLAPPPPLPPLSGRQRALWRLLGLGALPALLLLPLLRGLARRRAGRVRGAWRPAAGAALAGAGGLALLGLAAGLTSGGADLSRDGLNSLHPASARRAAALADGPPIRVDLLLSPRAKLPPELRRRRPALDALLDALRAAGAPLELHAPDVEAFDAARLAALAAEGFAPVEQLSLGEEQRELRTLWSALRLERDDRVEAVPLPDVDAWEQLEFRVAFALERLLAGRAPHVAFASDVPRLSAAEAHQFYQQQRLMAPRGKDVYSVLRAELQELGYRVSHVNPREPAWPADPVDVLVWLQPRRPAGAMLARLAEHLHGGGDALLAVQHFNIQSRQYRGADFEFVYWPQPQSPDVEHLWLPELGVELLREVAFDASRFTLELQSQVTRESRREFERMTSALPFHVRAPAGRLARDTSFTRGLGDLPLVWPSAWVVDAARLAELGLSWRPLVRGTERAWTYAWSGGWLPPEVLDPAVLDAPEPPEGTRLVDAPLVYAGLLEGRFPWPRAALDLGARNDAVEAGATPPAFEPPHSGPARPARLLLVGCSEMFKDERLAELREEFRADRLLLDGVAGLAFGAAADGHAGAARRAPGAADHGDVAPAPHEDGDLAALAARRPVRRGFAPPPEAERLRWRLLVPAAWPAALLVAGALLALGRRRT